MKLPSPSQILITGALAALLVAPALADGLPILTGEKSQLTGGITPVGDADHFRLDLFPGDRATVKVKDAGPKRGLLSTLRLMDPDGRDVPVTVKRQGSAKPSFSHTATTAGIHVVELTGDPGGFGGADGNYTFTSKIKRAKAAKSTLDAPGGGTFAIPIQVSDGALVDVKAKTKKGGFDIEGLFRPDGLPEPGFVESLKGKPRLNVKSKKFATTGGFGTYELRGTYDPGSRVKVAFKVRHAGGRKTRIADDEPRFDPFLAPFPSTGVPGTIVTAIGQNFRVESGSAVTPVRASFDDASGGVLVLRIGIVEDSILDVNITSKDGGFDLVGLFGPNGREEREFLDALDLTGRTSAATRPTAPFTTTRGTGYYELRGQYDAGAKVTVEIDVVRGDGADADGLPRVWVGTVEVDPHVIENPFDQVLRFPVPEGLVAGTTYDIVVRNADGQGASAEEAFYYVPPPTITGLSETEAGPAGGRSLRILGRDFRADIVVIFDGETVQPSFVLPTRIDVQAPPHAPGDVFPRVLDDLGQGATSPVALTYLDIGSNTITSMDPASLQGIGGESVTVTGEDFGPDSVLTLDGRPVGAVRVSSTEMTFVAPDHADGTVDLRVEDQYEQASVLPVEIRAITDVSAAAIPEPLTTENAVDGWRAARVLHGDVTGDDEVDLVLIRAAAAFGADVDRQRLRILAGDGMGGFTDATSGIPAITATDDWRARDAALVDVDGDDDLDIVLITDALLDDGDRSSLRLLANDGDGGFTDVTDTSMPAGTTAGDVNQGVAIAVADVDGQNGPDLVISHSTFFQETIDESPPLPDPPPEPLPEPVLVTYYYPGTRVLLNDGDGVFTRDDGALPDVDEDSLHHFEGDTLAAGDVDGEDGVDLVLTADEVREDPDSPGAYLRRAVLLKNDGSGTFSDASDTWLPVGSGAEYLQGDRIALVDYDGTGGLDLVVLSDTRLVTPGTGTQADVPALRIFENGGTSFAAPESDILPGIDGQDALQGSSVAFGDLSGDGRPDIYLVSPLAPNAGERGGRALVWTDDRFVAGNEGLPSPLTSDDGRGRDVLLLDVDGDTDLDVVIVRDEPDQSVRNTRVFVNPRVE
jgi:hypothetical protein